MPSLQCSLCGTVQARSKEGRMRIWVQVFSSRERNPDFHGALEEHLRSVADPGVQIEVHGTRKGGLGEQFRFFQTIDTPDIIENILKMLYQMPGQVVRERAKQDYGIDLS